MVYIEVCTSAPLQASLRAKPLNFQNAMEAFHTWLHFPELDIFFTQIICKEAVNIGVCYNNTHINNEQGCAQQEQISFI